MDDKSLQSSGNADSDDPPREYEDLEFPCESCGAAMKWSPKDGALACEYCGHTQVVEHEDGTIVERALDEDSQAARGMGVELRVMRCETCGARVAYLY